MKNSIIINTNDLNSIIYKDLCSISELLSKSYTIVDSVSIPSGFNNSNSIKSLKHKLDLYYNRIDDYKDMIQRTIKEIEKLSTSTIKRINALEKVDVSKATK